MHLEIASPDWINIPENEFYNLQVSWQNEPTVNAYKFQACTDIAKSFPVAKWVWSLCVDAG